MRHTFSWATATATPPCILAALPQLPDELRYRFVGTSLVLVDIEANLIVDVLQDAIDVSAILLGINLVRYTRRLAVHSVSSAVGIAALVAGGR